MRGTAWCRRLDCARLGCSSGHDDRTAVVRGCLPGIAPLQRKGGVGGAAATRRDRGCGSRLHILQIGCGVSAGPVLARGPRRDRAYSVLLICQNQAGPFRCTGRRWASRLSRWGDGKMTARDREDPISPGAVAVVPAGTAPGLGTRGRLVALAVADRGRPRRGKRRWPERPSRGAVETWLGAQ